jgi:hypothetical protein
MRKPPTHAEPAGLDVPPPASDPDADVLGRRRARRTGAVVALTACLVLGTVGVVGPRLLLADARPTSPVPASPFPVSDVAAPAGHRFPTEHRSLVVSGTRVGRLPLGTGVDRVVAAVTGRLGAPDLSVDPQRYVRVAGSKGWHEIAGDPLSPSWGYPVTSVTCWRSLCLLFGGDAVDSLRLRGWELAQQRRWADDETARARRGPAVRLARTGIRLGDRWERLHAAYPRTVVGGGEGASVAVNRTPWPVVSDGVAGWRLSGAWDYTRPTAAPPGAVVTRLSGGEGPQPGCC